MRGATQASGSNPDDDDDDGGRRPSTSGGDGGFEHGWRGRDQSLGRRDFHRSFRGHRRLSGGANLGTVATLPESILEAVAREAAASCAREHGPLAAGRALASIFQVCANWRAVSRSEFMWESVFGAVWPSSSLPRRRQHHSSWRHHYIRAHATASNIHHGRYRHTFLDFDTTSAVNRGRTDGSTSGGDTTSVCRCLAITERYLAGGFFDGTVRVFDLASKSCVRSIRSGRDDRFGFFSRAVSGIVLVEPESESDPDRIVFGSLDGSVFADCIHREDHQARLAPVHVGNIIEDGALISFAGSPRWWVGLYAGSPGRSFRVWDAASQTVLYSGGDATNADAMRGWHSFVEQAGQIGRVRVSDDRLVVAVRTRLCVYELDRALLLQGDVFEQPIVSRAEPNVAVAAVDVKSDRLLSAAAGAAVVRRIPSMAEVCRIHVQQQMVQFQEHHQQQLFGCLNSRQLFLCISGVVNAWDVSSGAHLYSLDEQLGDVYDLVASDVCAAACVSDSGIHLWDFSP